jgi:hypothetical protein
MNEADRWYSDLVRASKGDFSPSPVLDTYAPKQPTKIDLIEAFEFLLRTRQHQGEGNGPDGEAVEAEDQGVLRLRRTFRPGAHDRRQRLPVGGPPGQGPQDRQEEHQGRLDRFALRHRGLHGGTAQADAEPFRRHPRSRHGRGGTNPSNKKGFSDPEVAIILEATLAVGPLPSDDAGDTGRPKVGALNLRLFGRARQRDHFPPSVGHTAGPETGICCIYLRREMIKRDYRRLSCE